MAVFQQLERHFLLPTNRERKVKNGRRFGGGPIVARIAHQQVHTFRVVSGMGLIAFGQFHFRIDHIRIEPEIGNEELLIRGHGTERRTNPHVHRRGFLVIRNLSDIG